MYKIYIAINSFMLKRYFAAAPKIRVFKTSHTIILYSIITGSFVPIHTYLHTYTYIYIGILNLHTYAYIQIFNLLNGMCDLMRQWLGEWRMSRWTKVVNQPLRWLSNILCRQMLFCFCFSSVHCVPNCNVYKMWFSDIRVPCTRTHYHQNKLTDIFVCILQVQILACIRMQLIFQWKH